jgi:mannose/fructose/N-acetylgalactosamine-specific phosphotransferase system component IIB
MIVLWRLDDRLIHGQVIAVLLPQLNLEGIITVSQAVAVDAFRQELYRMACPPSLSLQFTSVTEAACNYAAWQAEGRRWLLLFENPHEMLELAKAVGAPAEVDLANLGCCAGRNAAFDSIYISEDEEKALRELAKLGTRIYYQQVPGAKACEFKPE